jgi:hypothetical protein
MAVRFLSSMAAAAAGLALMSIPAAGQGATAKTSIAIPRLPDGKPDLSGVWEDSKTGRNTMRRSSTIRPTAFRWV